MAVNQAWRAGNEMRLVSTRDGLNAVIPLSAQTCYSWQHLLCLVIPFTVAGGEVRNLVVDFSGEFVPIENEQELALACKLAVAHHNLCVRENTGVDDYEPYDMRALGTLLDLSLIHI